MRAFLCSLAVLLLVSPAALSADPAGASCSLELVTVATIHDPDSGGAYYPRLLVRSSGEVLCAFDTNDSGGPTRIRVSRSTNAGATWSDPRTVAESPNNLANAFLLECQSGEILCAYRETASELFFIRVSRSTDGGRTWKFLSTVHGNTNGLWEPWLLELPNGAILAAYASEEYGPEYPQVIEVRSSLDRGATWKTPVIAARSRDSRDGVPALVETGPGAISCLFEATDATNPFAIRRARSGDSGLTWSRRDLVYAPADVSRRAAAPSVSPTANGCILAAFYTDEDAAAPGDKHADMKWVASPDGGNTWTGPEILLASEGADRWGHFAQLQDGRILAAVSTSAGNNPRILARRSRLPLSPPFVRGDTTGDGLADMSDSIALLSHLFTGGPAPCCPGAADFNDSGEVDVSDPVYLLNYLFLGGSAPALPFPACGLDPTVDGLPCGRCPPCDP